MFVNIADEGGIVLDNLSVSRTVLSIEDLLLEQSKFLVYANPITEGKINVVLPNNNIINENVEVKLFSLRGELIYTEKTLAQKEMTLALPKQNLSGVYFLIIKGERFNSTQKVVF
ncbi:T9SS type A sorting domain-containing protein [Neotamlana nanhaiensis]|uniref:T9SS type A sorting domain-containing protein n=1 Tax=Neotamlana nanhaiensis TaxID=1382798 RepID=UPI0012FE91BE|nr:T9SS type A sorting domain-containing protein [Tamlana nanhaiensis]